MKYYIIAGELSGDLHASNLMKGILSQDEDADFRFWGGDNMQAVGGDMVHHISEMAYMGIGEIISKLGEIKGYLKECKADILDKKPDAVILVDFSGFNLRIGKFCKEHGIPVHYYIVPKVWAWWQSRAKKFKDKIDYLYCILPFEKEFYERYGLNVEYVGNPLLDAIEQFTPNPKFLTENNLDDKPLIAILPGSRKQEVTAMFKRMLDVIPEFPEYNFVVGGVKNLPEEVYAPLKKLDNVPLLYNQTYDILNNAKYAVVTSGTATLETALFRVPQLAVYATSWITYAVGKAMVTLDTLTLGNLIVRWNFIPDMVQTDFTPKKLVAGLKDLMTNPKTIADFNRGHNELAEKIGESGASQRAGRLIVAQVIKDKGGA